MLVVSPKFRGMKLIQQHRLMNKVAYRGSYRFVDFIGRAFYSSWNHFQVYDSGAV